MDELLIDMSGEYMDRFQASFERVTLMVETLCTLIHIYVSVVLAYSENWQTFILVYVLLKLLQAF